MGSPTTQTDPDQLVLQQYAKALALEVSAAFAGVELPQRLSRLESPA